jgi:hypothetical protein
MPQKNRVLISINIEDASRCVDIFLRPDNSFGFEEYRRDIEDNQGWFTIGFFGHQVFNSETQARKAALLKVSWLAGAMALKTIDSW